MIVDKEIKPVSEIKFLGVIIDEKLFWDAHIKSLSENHYFLILIIYMFAFHYAGNSVAC